MEEARTMPNRTIYVADGDLPLFERAQQLAGDNLSATIMKALRWFVATHENEPAEFENVTVKIGSVTHVTKRFRGRLLSRGRTFAHDNARKVVYHVYQTPKGNFAVYIQDVPNWDWWTSGKKKSSLDKLSKLGQIPQSEQSSYDWGDWTDYTTGWTGSVSEYRLEIYTALEELASNIPPELYLAVSHILSGDSSDGVEDLDI